MTTAIPALLLVAYVPGALLFRMPLADRARRAALSPEERAFWAIVISLVWTTFAALALGALGHYSLPHLLLLNGAASAIALVMWRQRLIYDSAPKRIGWSAAGPAVLVALGLWLYFPGSEYVVGGKDPGVYFNQGIQIAQRGTLGITDPTVAALPERFRDLFLLGGTADGLNEGLRFMGFFITNRDRGEVVGQFPQGFPVWIAVGYGLDGLSGARATTGVWAIMGLLATYLLWARLLGPVTAAAGTALLAVNVVQVWFARYPSSEVMQQALLAAALLALARAYRDGDRAFDLVAAATLGLMVFVRFDSVLVLAAVGGGFVLLAADGARPRIAFVLPLAVLLAAAVPYYAGPLRSYIWIPLLQLGGARTIAAMPITVAAGIAAALAFRARRPGWATALRQWMPRAVAAAIVFLSVYAYFWREPVGKLAIHDAYAMRSLGWYLTGPGVALAVLGLCLVLLHRFWRDPVTVSSMTALSVFFLYKVRIVPEHFWQSRRYLTVILPLGCVMAAAAATWIVRTAAERPKRADGNRVRTTVWVAGGLLGAAVLVSLGWAFLTATGAIAAHVEYAGVIPALEKLSARFGDRDLVVVESRGSSDAHILATPLAYIYARQVLLLNSPRPEPEPFAEFLVWASAHYDHVYFLADGGTALAAPRVEVRPIATERIETPEYESVRNGYPRQARLKKFGLSIFELSPVTAGSSRAVTDIDVGGPDDVWVLRIHGKEHQGAVSYRWTRNISYVNMMGLDPGSNSVTLWMSNGGRPAAAGAAKVRVRLNDADLGELEVRDGFAPYSLTIPADVAAAAGARTEASVLRLESTVWNPGKVLGVPDDRQLGVMLDRVRVQ
jgi:hypothetical protein